MFEQPANFGIIFLFVGKKAIDGFIADYGHHFPAHITADWNKLKTKINNSARLVREKRQKVWLKLHGD